MSQVQTVSVHLPFENIENCRDLAGIQNKEGKHIKPGLLFRSADLHHAKEQDILTLQNMGLQDVIDLRTDWEISVMPDHLDDTWNFHHIPVIHETTLAKESGGQGMLVKDTVDNMAKSIEQFYPLFIDSAPAITAWKEFFDLLINHPGKYLFHCTQGKDRTGIATALILSAMDVDPELIMEDYLQTNLYLGKYSVRDQVIANFLLGSKSGQADRDIEALMLAKPQYLEAAEKAAKSKYGSFKGYLREAIGLSGEDFQKLKDFYME